MQYLIVVNDSAERALGLIFEFHTSKTTKDSQQKQYLYQVVKSLRLQQTKLKGNLLRLIKQGYLFCPKCCGRLVATSQTCVEIATIIRIVISIMF